MKYQYISDSHSHSDCSFDGTDSVIMLCNSAVDMGLYALTVTDHFECNQCQEMNAQNSIARSFQDTKKAALLFQDRLYVYKGIEIGQASQNPLAAQDILGRYPFDFVLGSLHNLKGYPDFYFIDYEEVDIPALLNTYLDELIELIETTDFDALAHLTYPLRYIIGEHNISLSYELYADRLDDVLRALIQKEKALEINTSGLRQKIGEPLPCHLVIKRFRELGGKYVTIGSDAHRWADIGSGVEQGLNLLRRCGFDFFTLFIDRKPRLLPIA